MKTIVVANQKGGTGKSTSAAELAYLFSQKGNRVLLISYDQQKDMEMNLGIKKADVKYSVLNWLKDTENVDATDDDFDYDLDDLEEKAEEKKNGIDFEDVITTCHGFDVIVSDKKLHKPERYFKQTDILLFRFKLDEIKNRYDYVFVDTAPAESILHQQALCAADYVIIPCTIDDGALTGVIKIAEDLKVLKNSTPPWSKAVILGTFITCYKSNVTVYKSTYNQLKRISESRGTRIFETTIRQQATANEAGKLRKLINEYKPGEKVALDYRHLAKEIEDRILELSEGK